MIILSIIPSIFIIIILSILSIIIFRASWPGREGRLATSRECSPSLAPGSSPSPSSSTSWSSWSSSTPIPSTSWHQYQARSKFTFIIVILFILISADPSWFHNTNNKSSVQLPAKLIIITTSGNTEQCDLLSRGASGQREWGGWLQPSQSIRRGHHCFLVEQCSHIFAWGSTYKQVVVGEKRPQSPLRL